RPRAREATRRAVGARGTPDTAGSLRRNDRRRGRARATEDDDGVRDHRGPAADHVGNRHRQRSDAQDRGADGRGNDFVDRADAGRDPGNLHAGEDTRNREVFGPGTIGVMMTISIRHRLEALGARMIYAAIALAAVGLVAAALFMQHVVGLNPCPLCIIQRVVFLLLAVVCALAAWTSPQPPARRFGIVGLLVALIGAGVAAWHGRLKNAPELLSCGPGLGAMLENFPLTQILPRIFRGSGDCADPGAILFGVSLPGWALAGFLVRALAAVAAIARR